MNIKMTDSNTTTNYTFNVELEGEQYDVTVYLKGGKFVGDYITNASGEILDYEGEEGQVREDIMDYLDNNWDKLVG